MKIIKLFRILFAIRKPAENLIQEVSNVKTAWKTTEFWFNLASQLGVVWAAVQGFVPADIAAMVSIGGVAVYTVARTIAKAAHDIKAIKQTTVVVQPQA